MDITTDCYICSYMRDVQRECVAEGQMTQISENIWGTWHKQKVSDAGRERLATTKASLVATLLL